MKDVGTITKAGVALAMLFFLAAPAWAADNPDGYYQKYEHTFEQDVEGNGYAMVYQKVDTETLQLQNYMHGSGSMDMATLINSSQKSVSYTYFNETTNDWQSPSAKEGKINFVEQNEMVYSPQAFPYGTGYYEANPIVYNSKLKEKTCGKSYQIGSSMHHQIEYARGFNKDIEVNLTCRAPTANKKGLGYAQMRIDEEVTEGTVHIGELLTDDDGSKGVKETLVDIEEDYIGTFKITKNMEVCNTKSTSSDAKDWLSCCFGGYSGMDAPNKVGVEDCFFSCQCYDNALADYDPELGGNYRYGNETEQFPRLNK